MAIILNLESTICNDAVIFPLSINSSNVKIHGGIYSKKDFHEYFNHLRATRTERLHSITDLTYFDKQLNSHDSDSSIETLSGQSLYCGVLFNHFGHFMSESIHRMWPLRDTKFDHYLFCPFPNEKLANFQIAMFEYMGIPLDRIQLVSSPVRPESLVVPRQASLLGLGCAISSDYIDFLSSIENKFYRVYQSTRDYPEKIYVTRSNNIHTGGYAGESYIEKVLGREGFYIFSPENYSLHEQLAFYRNAELIVFSQGSAIHGLEPLGYLKAKIFVLSRNPGSLANFIPLINARCLSKYAFFDQISVLHPLQWSELKKVPKWTSNLAIVNLDQLIDFVIDNQISELNTFSQDEFWLYEAMDISRYLLNININLTPDLFFSYFIKFRDDILRLSKNPYLQNLKQK